MSGVSGVGPKVSSGASMKAHAAPAPKPAAHAAPSGGAGPAAAALKVAASGKGGKISVHA